MIFKKFLNIFSKMYKKPKSTSDDNFVLVEEKKCNNKIIQQQ